MIKTLYRVKMYNLLTLDPQDKLWDKLIQLTVDGWSAYRTFLSIRNNGYDSGYTKAQIRLVYYNKYPVAWGMWCKHINLKAKLCLFTLPSFRRLGIQKNLILPYWKKHIKGETRIQTKYRYQKEVFKCFTNGNTSNEEYFIINQKSN